MELALKQEWNEISQEEISNIEGGYWSCLLPIVGGVGMAIAVWDLTNCYEDGYNEVMSSVRQ